MTMVLSAALLISLSTVIGITCQKVQIDPIINFTSKCPEGAMIENVDSYFFTGKVSPVSIMGPSDWQEFVVVEARSQDNTFYQICQIDLTDAKSCNQKPKEDCYCTQVDEYIARFAVKMKAKAAHSNSVLRVLWQKVDKQESVGANISLPLIYDLSEAGVTVNAKLLTSPSSACQLAVVSKKGSAKLKLCCDSSSTPNPCHPEVVVDNQFFNGTGGSCVYIVLNGTFHGMLTYSLTICDRVEAKTGFCNINLEDGHSTPAPASDPAGKDKNSTPGTFDFAFAGLSISAIIFPVCFAGCLAFCLYKKCKKKKEKANQKEEKRISVSSVASEGSVHKKESKETGITDLSNPSEFTDMTSLTDLLPPFRPFYTPLPQLDEEPSTYIDDNASPAAEIL